MPCQCQIAVLEKILEKLKTTGSSKIPLLLVEYPDLEEQHILHYVMRELQKRNFSVTIWANKIIYVQGVSYVL